MPPHRPGAPICEERGLWPAAAIESEANVTTACTSHGYRVPAFHVTPAEVSVDRPSPPDRLGGELEAAEPARAERQGRGGVMRTCTLTPVSGVWLLSSWARPPASLSGTPSGTTCLCTRRFIRVQNEGTGKSSWWMLNPGGGKMGKSLRRRAVSMEDGTKWWKSKGRGGGKRSRVRRRRLRKRDCPTRLHPASTQPPPMANPPALELPQLADLTGTISLDEGYPQPPQPLQTPHCLVSDFSFSPASERLRPQCGSVYSQPGESMHRHHLPLPTIQECPEHVRSHGAMRGYSGTNALQSLLVSGLQDFAKDLRLGRDGPFQSLSTLSSTGVGTHSEDPRRNPNHHHSRNHNGDHNLNISCNHIHEHSQNRGHHEDHHPSHNHSLNRDHDLSHDRGHHQQQALSPRLNTGLLQSYCSLKAHAPYSSPSKIHNLPTASPAQSPGHLYQPYNVHHQQQEHYFHSQSTGYYGYNTYHYPSHSYKDLTTDSSLEFLHGNLDRGVEPFFLNDAVSSQEMGVSIHSSLPQGRGLGLAGLTAPSHGNAQGWVPG
ncbi:hypothetical protein SKAU_G00404860 [Synaphobranchus kaupii]|uniref:Uncharacterized protein n=1 Tax=Synaphobranchus kaupii TaxID=118154 RepID=A0A9Q1ICR9_SYNKA|nr:hypothetical protein SKAU_G00404860 [Synaphobranchus kaupii]